MLSDKTVECIRAMRADGASYGSLARRFGVAKSTIQSYLTGRRRVSPETARWHQPAGKVVGNPYYPPEAWGAVIRHLQNGLSLRTICAMEGMPGETTVRNWRATFPELEKQYRDALVWARL